MLSAQFEVWRATIERDRGLCVMCGRPACQVHHIIARSRGEFAGLWRIENLACLCLRCHVQAHNRETRVALLATLAKKFSYRYAKLGAPFVEYLE